MSKRWLEFKVVAYLIPKLFNERAFELGEQTGKEVDRILDNRYGEKKSEKLQEKVIAGFFNFVRGVIWQLISDWSKGLQDALIEKLKNELEDLKR